MTVAAAAMMAAAAIGSAETLKADIPFAFRAGHSSMQPGSYTVRTSATSMSSVVFRIYDSDTNRSVMTMPVSTQWHDPTGSEAVLSFQCTEGRCELSGIRTRGYTYKFATSKPGPETRTATVLLRPDSRGE
jgi:hypothetical protein